MEYFPHVLEGEESGLFGSSFLILGNQDTEKGDPKDFTIKKKTDFSALD